MCEQRGIDYTTNDATGSGHIVFNNDQAKSLISELVGYYDDGYFATKGVIPNSAYSSTYFTEGKIVMSIGSTGGTSYQTSSNFDVGVVPCPVTSSEGNGNKYISQGPSICFFKKGTTAQKEAAWNFYKFITRSLNTAAYGVLTGYEPVRTSAYELPSYQSYLSTDVLQAKVSACTSTLEGRYFNSPVFYGSATARDVVGEIFANVALGTKTLDGAFADAYVTATAACKTGE
jgi:multiple sugar transport system substrate-binding protein